VFDATKSKFSDVSFQQMNLAEDSSKEVSAKYGVTGIPCVVFLDGSGNVLFNGGPARTVESFTEQIQQFH